jgi:glycosyltransferase involved in cell wall biosynthesis
MDLLQAISLLKTQETSISALIIGSGNKEYIQELRDFCLVNGIAENILWIGFLPSQSDVHREAIRAKISVLPTHYDMIPGTIIESMPLKIPVISYRTGSIPEINDDDIYVELIEKNNIEGLAKAIEKLILNNKLRLERAEKGYLRAKKMFGESEVKTDILNAYHSTISSFKS